MILIATLALTSAAALAEPPPEIEASPLLAAEHCYENSPDVILAELKSTGWFDCETCVDHLMTVYADRVRPLVDQRCRAAAAIRPDLHETIRSLDQAFNSVTGGNWIGHAMERHAAAVDWTIIEVATRSVGAAKETASSAEDIRSLLTIWFRAHAARDDADAAKRFDAHIATAMAALARAEARLNADQIAKLRELMVRRVSRFL
jgi:hypothetical protein